LSQPTRIREPELEAVVRRLTIRALGLVFRLTSNLAQRSLGSGAIALAQRPAAGSLRISAGNSQKQKSTLRRGINVLIKIKFNLLK
jgi:hypothetical protein